jgi:hypothetical protein
MRYINARRTAPNRPGIRRIEVFSEASQLPGDKKMCRSIKTLRGIEPAATHEDIQASALQFVRKLSGYRVPSAANREVFDAAVEEVTAAAERMLAGLKVQPRRTRAPHEHAHEHAHAVLSA